MMKPLKEFFEAEYSNMVKRMYFRVRQHEDAEDIVMEAFSRAAKHWNSFEPDKKELGAWFSTILKNCLKDYLRDKFMKHMEGDSEQEVPVVDNIPLKMFGDQLREAIDSLGENERRDSCYLFFVLGYTYKEIAMATGVSVRNARFYTDEFKKTIRVEYG